MDSKSDLMFNRNDRLKALSFAKDTENVALLFPMVDKNLWKLASSMSPTFVANSITYRAKIPFVIDAHYHWNKAPEA